MSLSITLYRTSAILIIAVCAAGVDSIFRPVRLPERTASTSPAPTQPPSASGAATEQPTKTALAASFPDKGDITLAQARELFSKKAAFADARNRKDYDAGHVEGAWHMPLEDFSGGSPEAAQFLNKTDPIVVYCTGGDCHASHDVVIMLEAMGFTRCYVMVDGYPAWQQAGYETSTGPGPTGGGQ
ncbi:MAG: rhodanese-like domain-containing protein [Planctomycetes bacterium]|nr:rhodanese-like domain-containing protein [Planctomycetota bacterium]